MTDAAHRDGGSAMTEPAPLLEIDGLRTWIDGGTSIVRAVDSVGLVLARGETLALLGESGCGKSMTALSVMRLLPDAAEVVDGVVRLEGRDLLGLPEKAMREVRGARIGMIFQEPMLSLNPVMRVGTQIEEALYRHRRMAGAAARGRALELLQAVGGAQAGRVPVPAVRRDAPAGDDRARPGLRPRAADRGRADHCP